MPMGAPAEGEYEMLQVMGKEQESRGKVTTQRAEVQQD